MMTFNIYVPSYRRYNKILTYHKLQYCTYVVRKSEEALYRSAGIESILSVEDSLINSFEKVVNWLLDHAPEDVIAVIDDDIEEFYHRIEALEKLTPEETTLEIERTAQLIADLDLGYACCPIDTNVKYYDRPFKFVGVNGGVKIFNRRILTDNRFNLKFKFLSDIDFELHELMKRRIILITNYFCNNAKVDTNEGGNNSNKSLREIESENQELSLKWGKYYKKANGRSTGRVSVTR